MKKNILILLTFLLCTALLAGCSCQHEWTQATCSDPKTCTKCGVTEGTALPHSWVDADCEAPKTCSRCSLTEGTALGHSWTEATCTAPKTCVSCGLTEGQALEHTWVGEATLYTAPSCSVCGAEGEPLPGYFVQNGLAPNAMLQQEANYITNTYVRPDLDTTGTFFASQLWIFDSDDTHRAKKGYEWRCVDVSILFNDTFSSLYGTNISCARADYYQDLELKTAKKQERFTVTYNGKDYNCMAFYENAGFYYTEECNVYQMTCYVQVPVGYDGVVLAFSHGSIELNGMHLHEVEDENMLLLRLA